MGQQLSAVFVDDHLKVAEELMRCLQQDGLAITTARRVENEHDLSHVLATEPDAVFINPRPTSCPVDDALRAIQKAAGDPLIIFVLDEQDAPLTAQLFRQGAHDVWFLPHLDGAAKSLAAALVQRNLRRARRSSEAALRDSEKHHRLLFERHALPMWICAVEDENILAVNDAAIFKYGYTVEEFRNMNLRTLRTKRPTGETADEEQEPSTLRVASGDSSPDACYHRRKDGSVFTVELIRQPISYNGQAACVVTAHDVSHYDVALEEFRELENYHQLLVEQLPAILYTISFEREGPRLRVSPQVQSILGFTPAEWQATPKLWARQLHPADRQRPELGGIQGQPGTTQYRMLARDGRTVWIREQTINVRNARTGVRLALGLMFDISEQMEEAQRAHVFAAVIESLADPVMILSPVLDGDGPELICVNPSFTRVTGYTAADLSKAPLATLLGAGASLVELEDLKRRLRFRRAVSQLMPTQHCNGEVFPCEWNVNGVADEQGEVIHYVAILRTAFEPEPARRKGLEIHSCVAAA